QLATGDGGKLVVKRRPKFLETGKLKIRRHNPDDDRSFAVNPNALSNGTGIAVEIPFPNFVAQNDDPFRAWFVVCCGKIASNNWRYTSNLKKIFSDVTTIVPLRFVLIGNVDGRST